MRHEAAGRRRRIGTGSGGGSHALRLREAGLKEEIVMATVQEPTFLYELVLPPTADVLERVSSAVGHRALPGAEALLRDGGMRFECEIGAGEVAPTLLSIARLRDCAIPRSRMPRLRRNRPGRPGTGCSAKCAAGVRVSGSSPIGHHASDSGETDRRW